MNAEHLRIDRLLYRFQALAKRHDSEYERYERFSEAYRQERNEDWAAASKSHALAMRALEKATALRREQTAVLDAILPMPS